MPKLLKKSFNKLYKKRLFYLGLIYGQINLIKFVESNKFDNVAIQQNLTNFLFGQISQIKSSTKKKIEHILIYQINLMKKKQAKLKSPHVKRNIRNCKKIQKYVTEKFKFRI